MLEGVHDTDSEVITGPSLGSWTGALLPQPATKSVIEMAAANERLRAMFPLKAPSPKAFQADQYERVSAHATENGAAGTLLSFRKINPDVSRCFLLRNGRSFSLSSATEAAFPQEKMQTYVTDCVRGWLRAWLAAVSDLPLDFSLSAWPDTLPHQRFA